MEVILHENGSIRQRARDGYICATDLCKAAGKIWNNYWQNKTTQEFVECLSNTLKLSQEVCKLVYI